MKRESVKVSDAVGCLFGLFGFVLIFSGPFLAVFTVGCAPTHDLDGFLKWKEHRDIVQLVMFGGLAVGNVGLVILSFGAKPKKRESK